MSALGTAEEVASIVETLAHDTSLFAPPPVSTVAEGLQLASLVIAEVLKAIEAGAPPTDPVKVAEAVIKARSDQEMKSELGP